MQLSIIIPHYNCVGRAIKLIESIPSRDEIEVIIIDDNSTDDISLLREFIINSEKNIKLLFNTTGNKGAGASRNCGLKEASGKWLLFADADDFFVPGWYKCVQAYMIQDYDMVYFAPTSFNYSTGQECSRHIMYKELVENMALKPNRVNELNLKYCFCTPWSKLIKREIVIKGKMEFDEILASNDIMFITRCAFSAKSITADRNTIYCVTRDGKSMTAEKNKTKFMTRVDVLRRRYLFLKENLPKQDFRAVHMDRYALGKLVDVFIEHWGIQTFFEILKIYKDNHIKIWDVGLFNPVTLAHKAKIELGWWEDINKERELDDAE